MSSADAILHALRAGCPVRAVQLLLAMPETRTAYIELQLRRGERQIPLPQGSDITRELHARIDRPQPVLRPKPGAYCLAAYEHAGQVFGAVQHLAAVQTQTRNVDGFSIGCSRGEQAAIRWLLEMFGLRDVVTRLGFHPEVIPPLPAVEGAERFGESAGLAAAIATAWALLRPQSPMFIAATGRVDQYGNVASVDHVPEKVSAIAREAPFVEHVFVPVGCGGVYAGIEAIEVKTVADALSRLFATADTSALSELAPDEAAERSLVRELEQEHGVAEQIAEALLTSNALRNLDPWHSAIAEVRARVVRAGNLTHNGRAKEAAAEFQAIDQRLSDLPSDSPPPDLNFQAVIAAFRASTLIDLLDEDAAAVCQQLEAQLRLMAQLEKVLLLGSWSRALAASHRYAEAIAIAERQVHATDFLKPRDRQGQRFQALCNLIGALLGGPSTESTLQRVRDHVNEADTFNRKLPERAAKEKNQLYLDFWRCRYAAAIGDAALAVSTLPPESGGRFPVHHRARFAAEALLKNGQLDQALALLAQARSQISDRAGEFERLVLLTSAAVEATARIDANLSGWEEPARTFLDAFGSWKPLLIPNTWKTDADARAALAEGLRRIPY